MIALSPDMQILVKIAIIITGIVVSVLAYDHIVTINRRKRLARLFGHSETVKVFKFRR